MLLSSPDPSIYPLKRSPKTQQRSAKCISVEPDPAAARKRSATKYRFACLFVIKSDSNVIILHQPCDWVGEGHACTHQQSGYQSQSALASVPEKHQKLWRTLYAARKGGWGRPDPISPAILTSEISTPCGAWSLRRLTGALPPFSNGVEFVFFPRVSP